MAISYTIVGLGLLSLVLMSFSIIREQLGFNVNDYVLPEELEEHLRRQA